MKKKLDLKNKELLKHWEKLYPKPKRKIKESNT